MSVPSKSPSLILTLSALSLGNIQPSLNYTLSGTSLCIIKPSPSFTLSVLSVCIIQTSFTLSVLEVMSPQWSDLVLTTHIPHSETNVLIFYRLNIKTCKETKGSTKCSYKERLSGPTGHIFHLSYSPKSDVLTHIPQFSFFIFWI